MLHSSRQPMPTRYLRTVFSFCASLLIGLVVSVALIMPAQAAQLSLDYSGQDLQQQEFMDMKLEGANFSKANLSGAVFKGTNLKQANLRDADLSDSIAYVVDFAGADVSGALVGNAIAIELSRGNSGWR
jgi:uncharacterized protein YjbI with pentapeptide repeats